MTSFENYENDDYETAVEELPGILAYSWDGEFFPIEKCTVVLKELTDSDLSECLDDGELEKYVNLSISGKDVRVFLEPWQIIEHALDQLPAFDVRFDSGPPDAGPASGSGYLIFLSEDHELSEAESLINELVITLRPLVVKAKELQQAAINKEQN